MNPLLQKCEQLLLIILEPDVIMTESEQAYTHIEIQNEETSDMNIVSLTLGTSDSEPTLEIVTSYGLEKSSAYVFEEMPQVIVKTLEKVKKENEVVRTHLDKKDEFFKIQDETKSKLELMIPTIRSRHPIINLFFFLVYDLCFRHSRSLS